MSRMQPVFHALKSHEKLQQKYTSTSYSRIMGYMQFDNIWIARDSIHQKGDITSKNFSVEILSPKGETY